MFLEQIWSNRAAAFGPETSGGFQAAFDASDRPYMLLLELAKNCARKASGP